MFQLITNLKGTNKNHRLEGVVHSKVKASVDNDSHTRDSEATVQAGDSITGEGPAINIQNSTKPWHH
jgi:BioD-like phosphotransacetylase family protein